MNMSNIQVVCDDGSIKNVDTSKPGWEHRVRSLRRKHRSVRNLPVDKPAVKKTVAKKKDQED